MEEELEDGMEQKTTSDQMIDSYRRKTMEMGFTYMVPTNIFSPWDLKDNAFQRVTNEQIHRDITFM